MLLRARLIPSCRRFSANSKSSFDVDLVSDNYAQRTEWAAANFGNSGPSFRMVLPPPNVTGKLHLGHALTVAIEDSLCRHHRIKGGVAHWLPGFDHAGIATQSVVERHMWKELGLTRQDLSREDFISHCVNWSRKNSLEITNQLNRLGATLDWKNAYYTLDERFSSAVTRAFCELHSDKLIFRDRRIVNWCPILRSSLSDQEVERIDVNQNSQLLIPNPSGGKRSVKLGSMHKIRYDVDQTSDTLHVGTTRPETLFADVALAVHPDDDRFSRYIGKLVKSPVCDRLLPIIADAAVKMDKGTGVVKITPSHDPLDFDIASRHWDEITRVDSIAKSRECIGSDGRLINVPEQWLGLDRFDAREKILLLLSQNGKCTGEMKHDSAQVTVCSRTGDIIEPRLTEQWFLETSTLHAEAMSAITSQKMKIIPSFHEQRLMDWLSNSEPWCLSRQLLWGHRIPAYTNKTGTWVVANDLASAQHLLNSTDIFQDSDVLDTWFSSALVPLVTSGWMEGTFDSSTVPLNVMETGWDILGFWVARMLMLTTRFSKGTPPFSQIVLHGLIRDANGRKMSKSLGNVIDPADVLDGISQHDMISRLEQSSLGEKEIVIATEDIKTKYPDGIPKCGADALRFALFRHDVLASDIPLNVAALAGEGSRFCNKLWNLVAYMESVSEKCISFKEVDSEAPADVWIVSRLADTIKQVDDHMASCSPHLAFAVLHQFILGSLCDVYLEATKKAVWGDDSLRIQQIRTTLSRVVQPTLVQLSVFMPFVSEHLYERVFLRENGSIYFDFVKPSLLMFNRNEEIDHQMKRALLIVSSVRSIRQQLGLPLKMAFEGIIISNDQDVLDVKDVISDLVDLKLIDVIPNGSPIPHGYMPCNLQGSDDQLALRIDSEYRQDFIVRIQKKLAKAVERHSQFLLKAEKYEHIVLRDQQDGKVKNSVIDKSSRKASQARQVSQSAAAEAERMQTLLSDLNVQRNDT